MERLTRKSEITGLPMPIKLQESCGEDSCSDACEMYGDNGCIDCPIQKCMTRLAAYEDTGLEPRDVLTSDEMKKINIKLGEFIDYINLEEQGKLIKLSCKVGDVVYEAI